MVDTDDLIPPVPRATKKSPKAAPHQ